MPSLFGKRRSASVSRRPPPTLLDSSSSFAANTAARVAAGSRPQSSHGSLSSAAAAQALRSLTSSPEPVGSIQTKRMARRGSQSSLGAASVLSTRGAASTRGLQRRGSQGSMTERSFRSPSPGPNNGMRSNVASPAFDAPPVPPIPRTLRQNPPLAHKRSASMDPPMRVYSPTPNGRGARTSSMDRSSVPPPLSTSKGARLSDVREELERSESNRKVNFSRPRGPNSPPVSPTMNKQLTHGTGAWFSEPVHNDIAPAPTSTADALVDKMARIQRAAGQDVKRSNTVSSAEGTHLSRASRQTVTTNIATRADPPQDLETVMVYDAGSRTFVPQLRPKVKTVAPPAPTLPIPEAPAPGTFDPHTRTIVPMPQSTPVQPTARPSRPIPEVDASPPRRNPARTSPANSPRSSELLDEHSSPLQTPAQLIAGRAHRSSSLDVPSRNAPSTRGRTMSGSPSPSRKTHFSALPVVEPTLHDPPARDISPAKSALKFSPSSSLRTNSPLAHPIPGPRSNGSETSETPSLTSPEGAAKKKKKAARVSFDEQPHEIEITSAASSTPGGPSHTRLSMDDMEDEDLMKPRPALPSFGSIRKNRMIAEKVTEMPPERQEHSNDHAVGGILRTASGSSNVQTHQSVPPEIANKDNSGYVSDDSVDSDDSADPAIAIDAADHAIEGNHEPVHEHPIAKDFAVSGGLGHVKDGDLPHINLLPPSPGIEDVKGLDAPNSEQQNRQSSEITVPGGWAAEGEAVSSATGTGAGEQDTDPKIAPVIVHTPEEVTPTLTPINETTDSDTDAEFTDAAEDPSEIEGGFASIDAIAVSPVTAKKPVTHPIGFGQEASPDSPTVPRGSKGMEIPVSDEDKTEGDWTEATKYWSTLSKQQREQIERSHLSSDDEASPKKTNKPKKSRKPAAPTQASPIVTPAQTPRKSAPGHREMQPAQPAMKKSMRPQSAPQPAEPERRMRTSMRSGPMSSGSLRERPASAYQAPAESTVTLQKTMRPASSTRLSVASTQPTPATPAAPVASGRLRKEVNHDSDSESSFKKKRKPAATTGNGRGRHSMARSMRDSAPPSYASAVGEARPISPTPARGKDSFSIRSLSPTGSLFNRNRMVREPKTLRNAPTASSTRTTLRNTQPSKSSARQAATPSKPSRFKSRFADSDDSDDDVAPSRGAFKSRFADSDSDDAPALAPVRGIPRRAGQNDGDSTELEDSEDEDGKRMARPRPKQNVPLVPDTTDIDKAMEAARKKLGMVPAEVEKPASALSKGSLRNPPPVTAPPGTNTVADEASPHSPDSKKKRGFMSNIMRRHRSSQHIDSTVQRSSVLSSTSVSPVSQHPAADDASSPGKLLRRASHQPSARQRMQRGDSTISTATTATAPLTTTNTPWPLSNAPPVPPLPADLAELKTEVRPSTADASSSPGVRFSADNIGVYSARTGRKKKFGKLRRAFGLND